MASISDDVTGPSSTVTPQYMPHLAEHNTGFLLKVKSFRNIVTRQKPKGGFPSTDPCTTLACYFACTSEG